MNDFLFDAGNAAKANFADIYREPDPRIYFASLGACDYAIPEHAKPVFAALIEALRETREREHLTLLDLGCSYGVNGALLKHGLSLDDLYRHYADMAESDRAALVKSDKALVERAETDPALLVVGLDASLEAVKYATDAGFVDVGVAANLETATPSPAAARMIAPADMVISTGCVGYVTEDTFARILDLTDVFPGPSPWIASFVLRMFPYNPIALTMADHGLVTEKLEGVTFIQRRFADEAEQNEVLKRLDSLGIDPTGHEADGYFHAELYLSRPWDEAAALPLPALIPVEEFAQGA
jgi:hypothetical protein